MNTTMLNHEEHAPNVNSERGRAIIGLLYAFGFPVHRIGSLFDADHGDVSEVLNSTWQMFSEARLKPESSVSTSG
jgi:hypothetical protein